VKWSIQLLDNDGPRIPGAHTAVADAERSDNAITASRHHGITHLSKPKGCGDDEG
jgi:hypothetical protein